MNFSFLIIQLSRHLKNSLDKELDKYNITASQFSVLNQIEINNSKITSAEVADNLSSDRPTISGVINRLEKKNMVVKIDNPKDKRSSLLKLSDEGKNLINELRKSANKLNEEIFGELNEEEQRDMKIYLDRLINKVEDL